MADQQVIPAVVAKSAALANMTALDIVALEIEDAELVKAIAAAPSRVDLATLNARRGVIATAKKNHG